MKFKTKYLVVCIMLSFVYNVDAQEDKYQKDINETNVELLEEARQLRKNNNNVEAINKLRHLLEIEPEYYLAHYNLALSFLSINEYDSAITYFITALEIREKYLLPETSIYNTLGYTYYTIGDYSNAEKYYLEGIKEENQELLTENSKQKLYNNTGLLYMNNGLYKESEFYLQYSLDSFNSKQAEYNLDRLQKYIDAKNELKKGNENYYFAVVGSFKTLEKAKYFANMLSTKKRGYNIEIFKAENDFFAVTLGGYLNYDEALMRVSKAKSSKMSYDAYVRKSKNWGENLYK